MSISLATRNNFSYKGNDFKVSCNQIGSENLCHKISEKNLNPASKKEDAI